MDKEKKLKKIDKKNKKKIARIAAVVAVVLDAGIIIALSIALVITNGRLAKVNSRLSYLTDNTDIIMSDVSSLGSYMKEALESEASLIESWSISVEDTDFKTGSYKVNVTIVPKEYTEDTSTSIYFGTNEYKLELDGYKYVCKAILPISETYRNNVTVLFVDGNKRKTELLDFDGLGNDFDGVLSARMKEIPTYDEGQLKLSSPIEYDLDGRDEFKFNKFELIIQQDQQELTRINVIESGTSTAKPQEDTQQEETEAINLSNDIISSALTGTYISNEKLEALPGKNIRIFLRAETVDGFVFEYDVFNGVTKPEGEAGFVERDNYFESYACVYDRRRGKFELNK